MFNIVGFHLPKSLAARHGRSIQEKLDVHVDSLAHDNRMYVMHR